MLQRTGAGVIIAIQQPEHLPWMGFFNKMAQVDLLVILDNVQYKKRYFENRNKIRTADGCRWLTVPVKTKGRYTQSINQVSIDNETPWQHNYIEALRHAYSKSSQFETRSPALFDILGRSWSHLAHLNMALIDQVAEFCGIETRTTLASSFDTGESRGSDLIIDISRAVGADVYVSGPDGRNYLDLDQFEEARIKVAYHDFSHPVYPQVFEPFLSHMSTVDFLFNVECLDLVRQCYETSIPQKK